MRKTARFTFTALLLCAFAGALVMLTLCASAWASDTIIFQDPTGLTPGQVNITVIVGNTAYYYVVNNISAPPVQEFDFNNPESPLVGPGYPFTLPGGFVLGDSAYTQSLQALAYYEGTTCLPSANNCAVTVGNLTITGGIPAGSQAVFTFVLPETGPTSPQANVGGGVLGFTYAPFCDEDNGTVLGPGSVVYTDPNALCPLLEGGIPTPDGYDIGTLIVPESCPSGICPGSYEMSETFGTILSVTGTVTLTNASGSAPAVPGDAITLLNTLTTSKDGTVVIGSPDGSQSTLYPNSAVRASGLSAETRYLKMLLGKLWAKITPNPNRCSDNPDSILVPCDAADVTTFNAAVGIRGTDVVIEATATTTTVTVNEGTVEVDNLAGGTLNSINFVSGGSTYTVTDYESFSPASHTFAEQAINKASPNAKVTFKYTGTGTLTLSSLVASTNYSVNTTGITGGACNLTGNTSLATNQTCAFNVAFTPTSLGTITGTVTANFTGDPNGLTSLQFPLSGIGTEVTLTPAALAFGAVTTSKTLSVTVKNVSTTTLSFSSTPTITGTGAANFAVLPYSPTGPVSTCLNGTVALAENETCTYTVTFTGGVGTTSFAANLNIFDNGGGSPQVEKMTGTETEVSLTPATLAFGTVAGTETLSLSVQNLGTTPLTFSKAPTITGAGAANFAVQPYIAGTQSTCLETGLTLTQNQICTYTVTFTNAGGTTSFTTHLNIFDNGGGSPQLEKMTAKD